ncbi:amidase family protein [Paenibacillus solisilvae]|uniref:Amidase family protein n=1 Tax=Paenibacillus solisilvae TaxID=2486751 RepID=A0ABW0VRR1_9BACL
MIKNLRISILLLLMIVAIVPTTIAAEGGSPAKKTFVIEEATIADIQKALASGQLTSEALVKFYLQRIDAIDKAGPHLNSIITVNPHALETAIELDKERKTKGSRGPMHGIPVILKDNYDTADMPTTGGSASLKGTVPVKDAFMVKKLRDAGAIILAKGNLDEWAHGGAPGGGYSSVGGQTLNPYKLNRGPSGSSSGPGAAVAANLAAVGMGTDTLGSIRGPVASNALVGIKPTLGLTSRSGIIPFSLTFDVGGPIARSVADAAILLGVVAGADSDDPATYQSIGKSYKDYTPFLKKNGLKGARVGVLRNYFGANAEVDQSVNVAIKDMRKQGAVIVDSLKIPQDLIDVSGKIYSTISDLEFKWQLEDYFKTRGNAFPFKTLSDIIVDAEKNNLPLNDNVLGRLKTADAREGLQDPYYQATLKYGPESFRRVIDQILKDNDLDAVVFPTSGCTAQPLEGVNDASYKCGQAPGSSNLASLSGYPSISVPTGFASDGLPISVSFLSGAFSEPTLISLAYSYEQATLHRKPPQFLK